MKIVQCIICSIVLTVCSQAWTPPIGIPAPNWGPTIANPIEAVAPKPPVSWNANIPRYYYVESGGTNSGNGYPGNPRNLIPNNLSAGSVVFVNGKYDGNHRSIVLYAYGTSTAPVWILSFNPATPCTATKQWTVGPNSSYLIVDHINWDWSGQAYAKINCYGKYVCFRNGSTIGPGSVDGTSGDGSVNQTTWIFNGGSTYGQGEQIVLFNMHSTLGGNWQYGSGDPDAHGLALGMYVQDLWVMDCEFSYYSGDAIQIGAGTTGSSLDSTLSRRIYVGRCIAHHIAQPAFGVKRADQIVFSQNIAHTIRRDCPSSPNGGGFAAQYGPRNLWCIFNTVYDCQMGFNINSNSLGSGASTTDVYLVGNVFYDIHDGNPPTDNWRGNLSSQGGACISIWGGFNTYIINNTFDDYDVGIISASVDYNRFVEGNIFSNRNVSVAGGELILPADPNKANTFRYNIIQEIDGACYVRMDNGTNWQTVAAITKGPGNSSTPPTYVNKAGRNYALQAGSNGIDGFTITANPVYGLFNTTYGRSIAFDHAGIARPQNGAWDIGAFESSTGANSKLSPPGNPKVDFPK